MADILVEENFYMGTSEACVIDLTPPVFAGINFLDVESRGQIRAGWSAGTDANNPIRYEVYIQASSATGLFNTTNITGITDKLQLDIFTLPDGSFLVNGTTYYVGVRAVDALGNRDANTISDDVISTGVLTAIDTYEAEASFFTDTMGQFNVVLWANKNGSLAVAPSAILGTASYQIYDKDGIVVVGMSGSGITANAQGLYIATPITDVLERTEHYELRMSIVVDGEARVNVLTIPNDHDVYSLDGVAYINADRELVGSFWAANNGKILTSGLGTGSYQVYEADGTIVSGLSDTGITADANGFFAISPVSISPTIDPTQAFVVRVFSEVAGEVRQANVVLEKEPAVFDCFAGVSINALNQLQVSLWATKNNEKCEGSILGTASFAVYDKSGAAVSGVAQSGLTADSNGYFHSTPISAASLTDLTHYLMEITINVEGENRITSLALGLLGT